MDDTLKRLLEAELRAEQVVADAKAKREEITRQALEEARHAEHRFGTRVVDIHGAFIDKAKARAEQTIAELQRRYDERSKDLRESAEEREADAVEAALALLLKGIRG
jgi:L-lactate utilization protein LutC